VPEDPWRPFYLPPEVVRVFGSPRFRQDSSVRGLSFSPDGKLIASGETGGHTVHIWEHSTGKELARLDCAREGALYAVPLFRPGDGSLAVMGQHGVGVWDPRSWERTRFVPISGGNKHLSPTATHAVVAGSTMIYVWSVDTGELLHEIRVEPDEMVYSNRRAVGFSRAAPLMAYGEGSAVKVLDLDTGAVVASFPFETSRVSALAFSPDDSVLAAGSMEAAVRIFDLPQGTELVRHGRSIRAGPSARDCVGVERRITSLTFLPRERLLVAGGTGTGLWDLKGMEPARLSDGEGGRRPRAIPNGAYCLLRDRLLVQGYGTLLLDLDTFGTTRVHPDPVGSYNRAIAPSPDRTVVAMGDQPGRVRVISAADGTEETPFPQNIWWDWETLSISPDGRIWASGWNIITVRDVTLPPDEQELLNIGGCYGSPVVLRSGRHVLVRERRYSRAYSVWSVDTGKCTSRFTLDAKDFNNWYQAFERLLAIEEHDGRQHWLMLYDARDGSAVRRVDIGTNYLLAVAVSEDESVVAAGTGSHTYVLDVATGEVRTIPAGAGQGRHDILDVSPDGRLVCVARPGWGFRVYDASTGTLIGEFECGQVQSLRFTDDGQRLLSQDHWGRLVLWDLGTGKPCTSVNIGTKVRRMKVLEETDERLLVLTQNRGGTCYLVQLGTNSSNAANPEDMKAASSPE
jgi:WD40 repeat protein